MDVFCLDHQQEEEDAPEAPEAPEESFQMSWF